MQFEGQSSDCPLCTTTTVRKLAKVSCLHPGAARVVLAPHPPHPHCVALLGNRCQRLPSRPPPLAPLLILATYKSSLRA